MNPRILRLVAGFLAGFVLLSLLPALPDLLRAARTLPSPDQVGDLLLATAAGLCVLLLVVLMRRRLVAARRDRSAGGATRAPLPARLATPSTRTSGAVAGPGRLSELQARLRAAARKGERVPALARRHGISVDAVRTALGQNPPAPAARRGSSFRGRQQSVPAGRSARALPSGRTPYGALA